MTPWRPVTRWRTVTRWPALAALLLLGACGSYPQPFLGNPGATARRLAQPPPSRLAVPVPVDAMLDDRSAVLLADTLTNELGKLEVPAVTGPARPGDWTLVIHAALHGENVLPSFDVLDPKGQKMGDEVGEATPARSWAEGDHYILRQTAASSAPKVANLLTVIQARVARSDPNSLLNRAAHIFFSGVSGAPGSGNRELATQMRQQLLQVGEQLQDVPDNADFTVRCQVRTAVTPDKQMRVEIQWIVDDARGERGRVVQINDVPNGSLNGLWGDVALVVAQQSAEGVRNIITNSAGGGNTSAPAGAAPAVASPDTPGE